MPTNTLTTETKANGATAATASRMGWLDALRGLAALVVVFEHSLDVLLPEVRRNVSPWFDFGRYGVFLFFLISGYVVPFSLVRRGSVRTFWVGRLFRLYPAWFVSVGLMLALGVTGVSWGLPNGLGDRPWISAVAHLTMLQDLLGVPNVVNVFWTLSYEMVFYLLITAMFIAGVKGASARVSLGFGVAAAMLGVSLPSALLATRWPGATPMVAAAALAAGIAAMVSGRPAVRRAGVAIVAALALTLLVLDSRIGGVESLCIIATMFAGTAVRGIQDGRMPAKPAAAMVALVPVLTLLAGLRPPATWAAHGYSQSLGVDWSIGVAAAWLTFLGGLALRHRRMPRALMWLGLVSYSVYLLHPMIVQMVWRVAGERDAMPLWVRLAWWGVLLATVLVAAGLAHRYVERPAQRLGRRLTRREPRAPEPPAEPPAPLPEPAVP